MVKYAINWIKAIIALSKKWEHILLLLIFVQYRFGALRKLVSDKANKFSGNIAINW
jgi:hypothetical protein